MFRHGLWLGIWRLCAAADQRQRASERFRTYWQIAVGQWILDHHALPHVDIYSFTKAGEPWISSSWLCQVLLAASYDLAGWAGPVVLAAACIAVTFALLTYILGRRIPATFADPRRAGGAAAVDAPFSGASACAGAAGDAGLGERTAVGKRARQAPSFWLLPLIALWANLHGGFVFGLVLVGAFAIDALWNADRRSAGRWRCAGSLRHRRLGGLLRHALWMGIDSGLAQDSRSRRAAASDLRMDAGGFQQARRVRDAILALIAGALYGGVKLSPPRIALVLGLLHMALSHVRNVEIFALLLPLVVLRRWHRSSRCSRPGLRQDAPVASVAVLAVMLGVLDLGARGQRRVCAARNHSPAAAVDALKAHNPKRVLNDLPFGGYLIWRQMPVFIDGRAELYGEEFDDGLLPRPAAQGRQRVPRSSQDYDIDAVLLTPATPAVGLLDHSAAGSASTPTRPPCCTFAPPIDRGGYPQP